MASTANKTPGSQKVSPSKATNNVHSVLKILSSRLDVDGNIRDCKDVAYIIDLMREAVKLVDRCMFLNVLLATKSSTVLTTVLDSGGWGTLHSWLQECKYQDKSSFLVELLKLYKQLPVTVELLRQNTCAKDIKQLAKSSDEQIASSARSIVARWMERVKKASKDAPEGLSSRHSDKSNSHKSSSKPLSSASKDKTNSSSSLATKDRTKDNYYDDDTDPSRVQTLCDEPDHFTAKFNYRLSADRPQRTSDVNAVSDDSNSSTSASIDTQDSLTSSSMATSDSRRPKTVKMIGNKMRSTGLELDGPLPPTKKKPQASAVDKLTISIKPDKLPSIKKATPEKKSPVTTTPSTIATVSAPVEVKPKPKPLPPPKPREVYESSGFMDALGSIDVAVMRRKRKLSTNPAAAATKSGTNATVPSSPDDKKSMPSLNRETMDTSDESKPGVAKSDAKSGGENTLSETNSATNASNDVDMKTEDNKDSTAAVSEDSCSKDSSSQEPAAKKKKVKTVSWVEEQKLCEFFYFQLDENERVNVNKVKDFAETRKHEQEMEKQMMQNVRRMAHDVMAEKVAWKKPRLITGLTSVVVAGANSKERDTQREREQGVLLVIYFNRQTIPDSAAEPETEFVEYTEPKIIPLTDETGVGTEVSYSVFPAAAGLLPTPQPDTQSMTSLPPAIASLLANTAAAVSAGQPPNIVGFPPPTAAAGSGLPSSIPQSTVANNVSVAPPVLQPPQQGPPPPGAPGPSFNVPPLHVFLSMPLNVQQQIFQSVPFHVQQQMLNSLPPPLQQQLGPMMTPPPGGPGMGPPPPGGPGPYPGPPPGGVMPPNQQGPYPPPGLLPIPGGPPPNFPPGPGSMPPPYMGMNGPDVRGPRPPRMMMRGPHHPGRVCTHFLAGNCRYGSSCRHIHPPPDVPPVGHDSPH